MVVEYLAHVPEPISIEDNNKELPQIEKEITCLLCGDYFTDPTTLSCSHTFCRHCIMSNLQKNKRKNIACCPICCEILSQNNVESIPINFNTEKLVEAFKRETETMKCGNCEKEDTPVVWCIECNNSYCQDCNKIHENWKDFKLHQVLKLESPSETCNIHFKPMNFYCKTCNSVICQECTLKNHPFEIHSVDPIDKVAKKGMANIKWAAISLEQLLKQLRSEAKKLGDHEDLFDSESDYYITAMNNYHRKAHEVLIHQRKQLLQNLDSCRMSLKQTLAIEKRNVTLLEIQLEGCKEFTDNIMTANRTQQILLHNHSIMRRVNYLIEKVKNVNYDLQSQKYNLKPLSSDAFTGNKPLCFVEGLCRLPHCNIHVCTPVTKPKQVKLVVTLKDYLGFPVLCQSSNINIFSNVEGEFLQNVQVEEQQDPYGVYHIHYSVKKKIDHLIFVYWSGILVNHENIEVSVSIRDYANINKKVVKVIKDGILETPLKYPYSLAKGPNNLLIFGDDSSSQLVLFNDQLQYSYCIGRRGKENGEFQNITGIAVDGNEHLYVADSDLNCIQKFKLNGRFVYKFGKYGSENNEFKSPHGLLVCYTKLFVCDRYNHRIQVFIHEEWHCTIGQQGTEPGSFNEPVDLSVSNDEDLLFVADSKNHRVQVFTLDGQFQFLRMFDELKGIPSTSQNNPVGIFVTPDGYVLITCYHTSCIVVLDEDGTFVSVIESTYQGKEIFKYPCGIVMMDNGQIIIACHLANKLVVL